MTQWPNESIDALYSNMRKRLLRTAGITLCVPLVLFGAWLWAFYRDLRRTELTNDLLMACQSGSVKQIRADLDAGADPNARDGELASDEGLWQRLLDVLHHRRRP